ncbi:MAG: hypothetical protein CHACPFDD_00056 [Phycisphaerae bacterium]|nr:hypothetical protein [Phycisphaerae bacterium]
MRRIRHWLWLRAGVLLALAGVLLAVAAFQWLTSPARLRAVLSARLAALRGVHVEFAGLNYTLEHGLELFDVAATLADGEQEPVARRTGPVLSAGHVQIRLDPWTLLFGPVRARQIVMDRVAMTVTSDLCDGRLSRLFATDSAQPAAARGPAALPTLEVRSADVRLVCTHDGRARLLERWRLAISGRPEGDAYLVQAHHIAGNAPMVASVAVDAGSGDLHGDVASVAFDTALGLIPQEYAAQLRVINLSGRLQPTGLVVRRGRVQEVNLSVEELRCAIPVGPRERELPPLERFLQIDAGRASVSLKGDALRVTSQGRVNGAAAECELTCAIDRGQPDRSAWRAKLALTDFRAPWVGDARQVRFIDDLPSALRSFFHDYRPDSATDVAVDMWADAGGPLRATGLVRIKGGSCRYFRFPYDFSDLYGEVLIREDGMYLDHLSGRHGSGLVLLNGIVNNSESWTGFDLAIRAANVPLDEALYDALPPEYQRLWRDTSPIGLCDLDVRLSRADGSREGGPLDADVAIEADLLSASLTLGDERRLTHADGRVSIRGDTTTIENLHGFLGEAEVTLDGSIRVEAARPEPRVDVRVHALDLPIEHACRLAGGGDVRFRGLGEVWGRIRDPQGDAAREESYVVRVERGHVFTSDDAPPWTEAQGWVTVCNDTLNVLSLAARQGAAWVQIGGQLPRSNTADTVIDLQAGDLAMECLAAQLPSGSWRTLCGQFGLSGPGRLVVRCRPEPDRLSSERAATEVRIESALMKPEFMPLELAGADARVIFAGDNCSIEHLHADYVDGGRVEVSGLLEGAAPETRKAELKVDVENIELTPTVVNALPAALRRLLRRLAAQGMVNLALEPLQYDGASATWAALGRVQLAGGALDVGVRLSGLEGELRGSVEVDREGEPWLDARLAIARGALADRRMERWEARLVRTHGSPMLEVRDLRGRLCDGEVLGFARVDLARGDYEVSLTLQELSFEQFAGGAASARDGGLHPGRLDGHIFLRGGLDQPTGRTGGGTIRIRGGSFVRTPLLGALAEATRDRMVSDSLASADLRFVIDGDVVLLDRVELNSPDLRLVGEGRWNMRDDSVAMTLVGARPRDWPSVAILSDLLESAGKEFMQYRVSGAMRAPTVTAEPLHNLTNPIRKLLENR